MPHTPYSPTLSLSDFFVVVSLDEKHLKGKCFAHVEEMKQLMAQALTGITIVKFNNCFEQWDKHLNRCIVSNGEYFEGGWSLNM